MDGEAEEDNVESLCAVKSPTGRIPPLKVPVLIDGCEVLMEIDTGASRSIMSESVFLEVFGLKGSYKPLALSCVLTQKNHFL